MNYRAVIFDLFGTLVEMFPFEELPLVLSKMAEVLTIPTDEFIDLWPQVSFNRETLEPVLECACLAFGVKSNLDANATAAKIWLDFGRRNLAPRPDAIPIICELRIAGCRIGLVSNCSMEVPLLWKGTAFAPHVDAPIFSCEVGVNKPDPRIFLLACDRLSVEPECCLYVGDGSDGELAAGLGLGMQPVLVRWPGEEVHDQYRSEAKNWTGPSVQTLKGLATFLNDAAAIRADGHS